MIAFDKAVVAQKVKVQCCYIMADMLNLKKWGCCWVSSRLGWLLELLTELKNDIRLSKTAGGSRSKTLMDGSMQTPSQSHLLSSKLPKTETDIKVRLFEF